LSVIISKTSPETLGLHIGTKHPATRRELFSASGSGLLTIFGFIEYTGPEGSPLGGHMICRTAWVWLSVALVTGCDTATPVRAKGGTMTIRIRSSAFENGQPIPKRHTGDGEDLSPPLAWDGVPEGTKELALIVDDPDAPTPQPWVHWVLYKIPGDVRELPEAIAVGGRVERPRAALQGRNSWSSGKTIGYRGPAPPPKHGVHHYRFKLFALDVPLRLNPSLDKAAVLKAMQGHVLAEGELVGTYER
jgi:Raf kinase inhibitor-like YbhB/YbcL family protein